MDSAHGEEESGAPASAARTSRSLSPAVGFAIAAAVLLLGFFGTVLALNSTVFSASGFVSSYMGALERHDVAAALAMPGVGEGATVEASPALLRRDAMGQLQDASVVSDVDEGDGLHNVTVEYVLAAGSRGATTFSVRHTGPHLGVFSSWEFASSPLGVLEVVPHNTVEFDVNGVTVVAEQGADQANGFQVLVPGSYTLEYSSDFLEAEPATLLLGSPATTERFTLEVRASAAFVDAVDEELASYLDDCATQQVLQPTGCPFGKSISNRIVGLPGWSMVTYPSVAIEPGETSGTWLVPPAAGSARLTADVMSLFDGTVSTLSEDVTFTVSYLVTFTADGGITFTPR
ncbi:hypothetical protein FB562_2118 [Homoserinimonas aerilata]|uniref:Uncharacterized protein n=1 Tax=Homoserinimonas aerilata TaxID=1162970 RepID=A0A542YF53_9MICO|nr:hypothetical protein [Homoserinimonas aerilata]TQL46594.1 hypothetical protein FB562_2118 [Homoserinimonas aerilata]